MPSAHHRSLSFSATIIAAGCHCAFTNPKSQNVVGESHDHEIGGYVEEDVNDQENSGDLEENVGDESQDHENGGDVDLNVDDDHIGVEENIESPEPIFHLNIYDPKVWDSLNAEMKDLLIEKGPIRETNFTYPKDKLSRKFSSHYYGRKLRTGEIYDTSGLGLFNELQDVLKSLDLDIDNVRGQGYDNGSNMRGKHQGVQKRLLDINPRAFYMPCGSHCLNLIVCDMSLSTTRWESHIESVKAIKSQVAQINMVSTKLQSEDMRLDVAVKALEALVTFFENYRETGFASAMSDAKEIALDSEIDPVFQTKGHRPRKRHHDEVDGNEREQQSAEESFRTDYFLVIVDIALSQLKHRFEQLKAFEYIFGFLFDASKLISLDDQELKQNCMNLEAHLKHGNTMDVDGADLCSELQVLQMMLPEKSFLSNNPWTSMEIVM
ncbi:uncharacterized protein LOC126617010 [Malus sylvestris]|uniref:uncharacterized protein LOC126617010 n=1 Tax=Malus sylvestris TaxID=3752 RepID=UPI0021ACA668|nr:uncharacterized protein LOC126617010 [Malus sylvestris]